YRIASCVVRLPPLRERPADIIPLTRHFLRECRGPSAPVDLDPAVRAYLLQREYPGNVRDLRRIVQRIASRHVGEGPITPGDIPDDERPAPPSSAQDWRDESFDEAIRRALHQGVG